MRYPYTRPTRSRGFTLLELIVVVSILGMITSLATEYYVLSSNRERHETTVQRIQQIREAIVGDSSRTLNGEAMLSGFVVDVGRLPANLRELLIPAYCQNQSADSSGVYLSESTCQAASGVWVDQRDEGWKGPYLQVTGYETVSDSGDGKALELPFFRDGWGTALADLKPDLDNSGWRFERLQLDNKGTSSRSDDVWEVDALGNNVLLQSYGLDGLAGTVSADTTEEYQYEQDYPPFDMQRDIPLITEASFSGGQLALQVENQLTVGAALCVFWSGQDSGQAELTQEYALLPGERVIFPEDLAPQSPVQGVIKLTAVFDSDNDCQTDDGAHYGGEIVYSPSSSVVLHPGVPASSVTISLVPAPLGR